MFKLDTTNQIEVSSDLVKMALCVIAFFGLYFFGTYLQKFLANITATVSKKIGVFTKDKEYIIQRHIYQHSGSPLTKLYNWINIQIIALGLKRQGVTPLGYLLFWGMVSIFSGTIIGIVTNMGITFTLVFWVLCFIIMLMMTRVFVSGRIERRELDVMNAIDLIVPEAGNGIKNAITSYMNNFAPSIRDDFKMFISNINERGYSFEDAMYMLTDNLGTVFKDFAQKSIYFERIGEKEMLDIFADITETNRLRRQLRDENTRQFITLRTNFAVSVLMTAGYFGFLMVTDDFSRNFFLMTTGGKILLIVILMTVVTVLGYITTIKSKAI